VPSGFLRRVIDDSRRVPSRVWKAALAGQMEYIPSPVPLRCPATVIGGEEDGVFSAAEQRALVRILPNASFHIEPGIGHAFHWEDPDRFVALMQ
jgi:non-heme chloroperoxidase